MGSRAAGITRRGFLTGSVWAGLTAARARADTSLLGRALAPTYDVVVVGAGAAGMSAALGARRADPKARIVLLEAKPTHGGTSFRSGGRIWIPNNSDLRAAGLVDPRDMALRYMARLSYPDLYDASAAHLGLDPRHHAQLEAYYDHGAEIFDYYRDHGILDWEAERWELFPWNADPLGLEGQLAPDYHPDLEENVPKRGRALLAKHVDPTHLTSSTTSAVPLPNYGASLAGIDLAQWLFVACLEAGIELHVASRATDLLTSKVHGRTVVQGVEVTTMVNDVSTPLVRKVRARHGVVFASGGFSKDRARLDAEFTGDRAFNGGGCAVTSAKGDLVGMAEAYGLKLEHMDTAWFIENVYEQYQLDPDSLSQANYLLFQAYWLNGDSMFTVNRRGVRVVNEKIDYDSRTKAHFHPDNRFLFSVFDQHTFDHYFVGLGGQVSPLVHTLIGPARTIPALRDKIRRRLQHDDALREFGLAPDFASGLEATLARFNGFARSGHDVDFHRGETSIEIWWHSLCLYFLNVSAGAVPLVVDPITANVDEHGVPYPNITMRPLEPPFYAVILSQGLQDTKGGPAIDAGGRVLGLDEQPIRGLYGAGNAIASPAAAGYWGAGGTLGPAMVFGHLAGRNAATGS